MFSGIALGKMDKEETIVKFWFLVGYRGIKPEVQWFIQTSHIRDKNIYDN